MAFDCEQTYRRMQDYLDRELTAEESRLVREHLEGCGMCAEEYRFERSILRRVGQSLREIVIPGDLLEKTLAALDRS